MTTKFQKLLLKLNACEPARTWVGDKTLAQSWATAKRSQWMLWLYGRAPGCSKKISVGLALEFAAQALDSAGLPAEAVKLRAPFHSYKQAADAASAARAAANAASAASAASAAWDAAWAADAASDASAAASAAARAARAAASVADATASAAAGAAEMKRLSDELEVRLLALEPE